MKYKPMKALVEALRSGKYKQTDGVLRNEDKFCCLGVACDLSKLGEWKNDFYCLKGGNSLDPGVLPEEVKNYYGFATNKGCNKTTNRNLTGFNDQGKSFKWIANYIEKNWKSL